MIYTVQIVEDNENGLKAAYASGAHVLKIENIECLNFSLVVI